jgi:ribosomal protein S27E
MSLPFPFEFCVEGIPMDKNHDNSHGNKSYSDPLEAVIKDVIQTIETVDKKMEEFYAIHGTELQVTPNNRHEFRGVKMKINCISCEKEVNLDHEVFENYEGPVKCFSCGAMLEIQTSRGVLGSINLVSGLPLHSTDEILPSSSRQSVLQASEVV